MRIFGVDAPHGWACLDINVSTWHGGVVALGALDEGHETEELRALLAKWLPAAVVIETPLEPYIGGKASDGDPGQRRAIVTSLLRVARLGGRLEERAIACGIRTLVIDAAHVRRALGIRGKSETELDRNVKSHLRMLVRNWPERSNVDERDAGAACLWAARQPSA
jgi:hypothetical protein